jgi:cell shape-determining protein MreD
MQEKSSLTYVEALIAAAFVVYLAWDWSWGLPPGGIALILGAIIYFAYLCLMRRLVRAHQRSYEAVATILALAWGVLAYCVASAVQASFANQIPSSLLMHLWPWIAAVLAFIGALASKVRFMDDVREYVLGRRARWDNQQWLEEDAGF